MIAACRYAREQGVPYLGICLGMQVAVIEFCRNVCAIKDANSGEFAPQGLHKVIDYMPGQNQDRDKGGTLRLGSFPCRVKPGTKLRECYGQDLIHERHRHRFEFNNDYRETVEAAGMVLSGLSPDGRIVETVELAEHPFFVAGQFHPEFKSRPNRPHPLFAGICESGPGAPPGERRVPVRLNEHFKNLGESYLFVTIAKKVAAYQQEHPEAKIIRLGIGDVTRPPGSGGDRRPAQGGGGPGPPGDLPRLLPGQRRLPLSPGGHRRVLQKLRGGAGPLGDLCRGRGQKRPGEHVRPVRSGQHRAHPRPGVPRVRGHQRDGRQTHRVPGRHGGERLPPPAGPGAAGGPDLSLLPNNPTGAAYNKEQLQAWVDYALEQKAVLLYDAAYEAFITEPGLPHSIFEIPGAKQCAMEFCSLSKTAGFTGMRCGYTVLPRELRFGGVSLGKLWQRRQGCKFNGVSYLTQRGAQAVFTPEGQRQIREAIACYQENARVMMEVLDRLGIPYTGGVNSPYLWLKCPEGLGSWDYFDFLLERAQIVGTPGEGFGRNGEGWFRLTAFGDPAQTREAMARLERLGQ